MFYLGLPPSRRHHCNAEPEAPRSSPKVRFDLFLVYIQRVRQCESTQCGALERGLSTPHSRRARIRCRLVRPISVTKALERLGDPAHHGNGNLIHFLAHRLLCGQRKEPPTLERPSAGGSGSIAVSRNAAAPQLRIYMDAPCVPSALRHSMITGENAAIHPAYWWESSP